MITNVMNPVMMDEKYVSTMMVEIDDFHVFTKFPPYKLCGDT